MSHRATTWAIERRGLKPATKIVLFALADRHNPDLGCFPSQARLADDCEMSRSSINNHLDTLEKAGLLRRVQRRNSETNKQLSTRYVLGFEPDFEPSEKVLERDEPSPEFGHGNDEKAVSKNDDKPCPKNGASRVQNLDTNLVREPVREPVNLRERAQAGAGAPDGAEGTQAEHAPSKQSILRALRKVHKSWPTFVTDSTAAAQKAWFELSPEERDMAGRFAPVYVQECRANGRSKVCAFATYLHEKPWNRLSDRELQKALHGGADAASDVAAPFGKAWGALWLSLLQAAPVDPRSAPPPSRFIQSILDQGGVAAEAERLKRQATYGWPRANRMAEDAINRKKGAVVPPDLVALGDCFSQVKVGGEVWAAWRDLHARVGWPWFDGHRLPEWIYLPALADGAAPLDAKVEQALRDFQERLSARPIAAE